MCRRIAWSWSISQGVLLIVLSSDTGAVIQVFLMLEYQLIEGLYFLLLINQVHVMGSLLSSTAAAAVNSFVVD